MSNGFNKEIVAGQNFYYLPAPFMALKVSVDDAYNSEKMKKAVLQLETAHPTINNVIEKTKEKMCFKDAGVHVPLHENKGTEVDWKDIVKQVVQQSVDLTKSTGVSVHVVDEGNYFDLIIICHHIYGDGISLKQLMDDLLYIYNTGHDVKPREGKITLTEEDLPETCKIPEAMRTALKGLIETWEDRNVEFSYKDYEKLNDMHHATVGYGMEHRRIKGTTYRKLKGKCKELNVTLNSALSTAIACVLQDNKEIDALIAADTRDLFRMSGKKGLANCASCVKPTIKYDKSIDFWDNVKIVDTQVKEERANIEKLMSTFQILMLLKGDILASGYFAQYGLYYDKEVISALMGALSLGSDIESFDVSNIGIANFETNSEDFKLRHCCYIPNITMTCDCTFGAVTMDGTLDISLAYKANNLKNKEQDAVVLIDSVIKTLINFI